MVKIPNKKRRTIFRMRKLKRVASRVVALSMATLLVCSGAFDNISILSKNITSNVSGMVQAQATTTGTVNADVFSWDNASVYFLLTDRFKNGNTSNDHSYGRGLDKSGNVINVSDDRGMFHGGDFAGITQTIKDGYFNDLGVNAIWISAPYEQIHGYIVGSDDKPSYAHYSYHGYYVLDYTDTDANFGTEEEFRELVDTAHEHGIRIIMDIVLNHAGYNSLYDMNQYNFGVLKDGWDSYYFSMTNVNNADYHSYIDYEGDEAQWGKWWGSWVRAGLPGYTEGGGDPYTMSLSGLPDFKTESTATVGIPTFLATKWKEEGRYDQEVSELKSFLSSHGYQMTVTNCISYWLSTWVREYGVDGFRCDTAKHVELSSWKTLKTMCTDALKEWKQNNPDKKLDDLDFWMTGECWNHGVSYDDYYKLGGFDSMINFDTTGAGVLSSGTVAGKYEDYAGAINTQEGFNVLSYISSHDSVLARGDQIYIGSAFLLLPGAIQIYYGDETNRPLVDGVPFDGSGGAGHSLRSDMNWDSIDEEVLAHWQKVGIFRSNHIAVGAGTHTTVDSSSGVAFVRTYSKGNVKDRVAACIGASANTTVAIDVSAAWNDGETVVNYYDLSSAVVKGGKVEFNSGSNGTILIGDPDGKPLVNVSGNGKFKGTQTVTISVKDADYAIVSVDGGKKFIAHNGDTFKIGETAYEGDTVSVSYKATNSEGTINGKTTFYKAYEDEDIGDVGGGNVEASKAIVHVKMADGSAPNIYAWKSDTVKYSSAWPGDKMTEKDSEGYYTITYDTTEKYNVIFNNGTAQTTDITGLKGEVWIEVASDYSYTIKGDLYEEETVNNVITIHVKPYSGNPAPCLYVWNDTKAYNGGFPGKQLTEKDDQGFYVFNVNANSVTCIVSNGSNQNQSGNISGITGEAWITMTSADNSTYDIEKIAKVESKFSLMKAAARTIRNMVSSDYTTASWNKLYSYLDAADKLVAQGEEEADTDAVNTMYNNIIVAKNALILAAPKLKVANTGSKVVKGIAACEATVTVTIDGTKYIAVADEVTGIWTVNANSSLTSATTITMSATRNGLTSESGSYNMSRGNKNEKLEEEDEQPIVVVTGGWKQDSKGWWYQNADGTYPKNAWKKIDGKWYHFDANGYMQTGWYKEGTTYYYLKSNGAMATDEWVENGKYYIDTNGKWVEGKTKVTEGWKQDSKGWWYQNADGTYPKNAWKKVNGKWYHFDANGYMQTGWYKEGTTYYYLKLNGALASDEWVENDKYYIDANGKWVEGKVKVEEGWKHDSKSWWYQNADGTYPKNTWKKINGKWYHFDANGYMQTGWYKEGTTYYYLKSNGALASDEWVENDKYYIDANGKWVEGKVKVEEGWKHDSKSWWYQNADGTYPKNTWKKINGKWYHFDANGYMQTGWYKEGTTYYYLKSSGALAADEWVEDGKYYIDANGKWVEGKTQSTGTWKHDSKGWWYQNADGTYPKDTWQKIDGNWYHFNISGYMQTGWYKEGNVYYYLKSNGVMAAGEWVENGKYYIDSNGYWIK